MIHIDRNGKGNVVVSADGEVEQLLEELEVAVADIVATISDNARNGPTDLLSVFLARTTLRLKEIEKARSGKRTKMEYKSTFERRWRSQ